MNPLEQDLRDMERLVAAMLTPLRDQPLRMFIRAFTGCAVLPAPREAAWLDRLASSLTDAGREINAKGLYSRRANEVGNKIEDFVKDALNRKGFQADTPKTKDGKKKNAGYPDIEVFVPEEGMYLYLECKTYNPDNKSSSLRSFYLSPPLDKVTKDAVHLLVAYQMNVGDEHERRKRENRYYAQKWMLLDLYGLSVDVKHEIQTSNKELYSLPILREQEVPR